MLQDMVKSYNDTLHHTIGMKPNEVTRGTFYEAELQKVTYSLDQTFEVVQQLNHRGHSRKQEVLVKWKGWPDKFNSWVAADMIDNQPT